MTKGLFVSVRDVQIESEFLSPMPRNRRRVGPEIHGNIPVKDDRV